MNNKNTPNASQEPPRIFEESVSLNNGDSTALAKNFVANVFSWMVVGLLITGFVASYAASSGLYAQLVGSGGLMMWVILLSPFAFIIAMNAGLQKFSATTLTVLFLAFSRGRFRQVAAWRRLRQLF